MKNTSTEEIRKELCKHIVKTSAANSDFAYVFVATERVERPQEVSYAVNGDSGQLFAMLATIVHSIAKRAGVTELMVMQEVYRGILQNKFKKDG